MTEKGPQLNAASTRDEVDNQHHDRDHEQYMNQTAAKRHNERAEQPEHQQNNEYCPQHNFPPIRVLFNSHCAVRVRLFSETISELLKDV
jgi:hypothetical protein